MIVIKPSLLRGREYLYFASLSFVILLFTLSVELYRYQSLIQFDDALREVEVLRQYEKERAGERYTVLKLRSDAGAVFYITTRAPLKVLVGYRTKIWLSTKDLSFLEYMSGFVTRGRVLSVERKQDDRYRLGRVLDTLHSERPIAEVYGALFLALPLGHRLQEQFSFLGVSHLLAISGFHLGVLSFILLLVLRYPYRLLQQHLFPYRHGDRDLFIIVAVILGLYLLFLGDVPSLIRAYMMLLIGYLLHDRGIKVLSMQTLWVTVVLLLVLMPRLLFSLGFWLSVSGVYFIFLYLHYYKASPSWLSMLLIPLWVYLLMTPVTLLLFGNYSLYHPLSVIWSLLFTLFYPLALLLHVAGYGDLLDGLLQMVLEIETEGVVFDLSAYWLIPYGILALTAQKYRMILYLLLLLALGVTIAAVDQVA